MVSSLPIATRLDAATRHDRHALGVARNGDLTDRLEKLPRAIPALPKRLNEIPRKLFGCENLEKDLEKGSGLVSGYWTRGVRLRGPHDPVAESVRASTSEQSWHAKRSMDS